jgi:hypothetical protein
MEQRLESLVEKLRSGKTGRVREASILVSEDGSLTLEVKLEEIHCTFRVPGERTAN